MSKPWFSEIATKPVVQELSSRETLPVVSISYLANFCSMHKERMSWRHSNPKPIAALWDSSLSGLCSLQDYAKILENHYKDMQDIGFTIERVNSIFSN